MKRGVDEIQWILEVEDALGGSTVWDDRFASDQLALEAALHAIKESGIRSFNVESPEAGKRTQAVVAK